MKPTKIRRRLLLNVKYFCRQKLSKVENHRLKIEDIRETHRNSNAAVKRDD